MHRVLDLLPDSPRQQNSRVVGRRNTNGYSMNQYRVHRTGYWVARVLVTTLPGCGSPLEPSVPMLETDSGAYTMVDNGLGFEAHIPYRFTNRTFGDVYLANCRGAFSLALERRVGRTWKVAWSPAGPLCASPPIVIHRDATFADTLRVFGARPSTNFHPQFDSDDPRGTYRIVWYVDIPLAARTSNAFALELR